MLDKKAIREIPVSPDTPGFYSPIFLVAKESGGWRPILNLKAFNKFVVPPSFRMETLRTVMDCLGEAAQQRRNTSEHLRDSSLSETWAISIDLRDAYFHVAPEHTRYLRFAYNGRAFEFLVLPFGLSTAPRVFTRIVRVIEAFLKIQGVDMHQYLDDWLMKNQSRSLVERHRDLTLFWVDKLGFLVNEGKSQLVPTQTPAFLGSTLDLLSMLVFPSERRILRATRLAASLLARTAQPAKTWQRFLGHLSSLRELVPMAVVHTRPIQLMLHDQWTQVSDSPYVRIYPNEETLDELEWWALQANLRVGRPFLHPDPTMSIVTDASKEGWGGHLWRLGGLRALVKSLGQATHQLARASSGLANPEAFPTSVAGHCCGCHFRQYHHGCLYQQGGRDSVPVSVPLGTGRLGMVQATRDLSCGQPPVGRQERPRGRPVQRDPPSSDGVDPPQRGDQCNISTLAHTACGPVRVGEEPQVASVLLNSAVPVIERGERPDAELGLPLRVRVPTDSPHTESAAEAEASADSPDPPGSPVLAQPAVVSPDDVDVDGSSEGDLSEGRPPEERGHGDEVPQTGGDEVDCMASVRKSFVDRIFSANVADTAARARRESTRRVYGSRLKHYQRWCVDRGVDPVKAPLTEVAEFLENLRTVRHKGNPLAPSTFAGYRSAIAAIHQGFSDGSTVSSNTDLSTLLKGIFMVTAKPRTLKETWDLPTVLRYLAGPPFEPLATAPLKSVAIKTAFLIQLASARRVSWVHSCRIDPSHLRWENGGVRLLPSLLLDKNQSSSFTPSSVFLLSLKEHSPDDKVHCPLRALKWYLKLTEPLRGAEKALFIISKEPYKKASKGTVAGWVKEAISGAYSHLSREQREQMGIRAHDTRGVATTWAATVGVPFEEIMDAAAWSRPQTFARFYLKDLPAMRGRFSRAVMVN